MNRVMCASLSTSSIKGSKICSKTKALKLFKLKESDFVNIKELNIELSHKPKHTYYLYSDILNIVAEKYGSIGAFKSSLSNSKSNNYSKSTLFKEDREKQLREAFYDMKLEPKNSGDCYTYINYGVPDLDQVIKNEITKLNDKTNRRVLLASRLDQLNISFDESLSSCYNYINNIGSNDLDATVNEIIKSSKHMRLKNIDSKDSLCVVFE